MEIQFVKKPLKEAENLAKVFSTEENYKRLHITLERRQFIDDLVTLLIEVVPMKEMAMRGFILRSFKKWQEKNQRDFNSIVGLNSSEGFKIWIQLCSIIFTELTRHIIQGEAEWELECLIGEAFTLFQAQFCID